MKQYKFVFYKTLAAFLKIHYRGLRMKKKCLPPVLLRPRKLKSTASLLQMWLS